MRSDPETPYCTQGARHWFAYYGMVGSSAPTCQRCGASNPNYDEQRDDLKYLREANHVEP